MSLSTSRLAYQDCFDIFDRALADPKGARVRMPDHDAATFLRMRMHQARSLDKKKNSEIYAHDHPMHGVSEYDCLIIRIRRSGDDLYLYLEQTTLANIDGEIEPLSEVTDLTLALPEPQLAIEDHSDSPAPTIHRRL